MALREWVQLRPPNLVFLTCAQGKLSRSEKKRDENRGDEKTITRGKAAQPHLQKEIKVYIRPETGGFAARPPALGDNKNGYRTGVFIPNVNEKRRK